jgi:hypothetical protein
MLILNQILLKIINKKNVFKIILYKLAGLYIIIRKTYLKFIK